MVFQKEHWYFILILSFSTALTDTMAQEMLDQKVLESIDNQDQIQRKRKGRRRLIQDDQKHPLFPILKDTKKKKKSTSTTHSTRLPSPSDCEKDENCAQGLFCDYALNDLQPNETIVTTHTDLQKMTEKSNTSIRTNSTPESSSVTGNKTGFCMKQPLEINSLRTVSSSRPTKGSVTCFVTAIAMSLVFSLQNYQ